MKLVCWHEKKKKKNSMRKNDEKRKECKMNDYLTIGTRLKSKSYSSPSQFFFFYIT